MSSVAVINAGSSSIKFAVYDADPLGPARYRGQVEGIGSAPRLKVRDAADGVVGEQTWAPDALDHASATLVVLTTARDLAGKGQVVGVGHRVVHGGIDHAAPVRVDASVIDALAALSPLAPLHQPHNLAPIRTIAEHAPHMPQVACFDTAFHRVQPPLAQMFALPRRFHDAGVRRYGFHGLSYEFVSGRLRELDPTLAAGRVVIAHLGNGASLCAVQNGRSVASTMGFTAVDGLMMGTRCGTVDPGVLIHLMDAYGLDARGLEDLVYKRSGLLGVSGVSSDMRALRNSPEPAAAEAIALFVYRVVREIGSMAAALGGIDGLVFTGGIGENDAAAREAICDGCRWLGVELGEDGQDGARRISRDGSKVAAWVIPTDEEWMIARRTVEILAPARPAAAPVA